MSVFRLLVVLALILAFARMDAAAQTAGAPSASLVTVQLAREGDVSIVTLEADGPLPEPTFGVAHDPFRFYVDFPNVAPESRGVLNSTDPLVVRVRVATYSVDPLVSRVVLDLKREMPIRVDTDGRGAGRIRILVGMNKATTAAKSTPQPKTALPPVPSLPPSPTPSAPDTTQAPPVQAPPPVQATPPVQAPPPPKPQEPPPVVTTPLPATAPPPATKTPAQPATPAPGGTSGPPTPPPPAPGFNPLPIPPEASKPQRVDDRYRTQIAAPLDQMRALRPLLASIDVLKTEDVPGIPAAIERVESIRQALAEIKPAPDRGPTHDMLLQSCTLAQRALKLRMSGSDPTVLRNAGSAAAGALLLLDRVCIDVGCDAPPKR